MEDKILQWFMTAVLAFMVIVMGCIGWAMVRPIIINQNTLNNIGQAINAQAGRITELDKKDKAMELDIKELRVDLKERKVNESK